MCHRYIYIYLYTDSREVSPRGGERGSEEEELSENDPYDSYDSDLDQKSTQSGGAIVQRKSKWHC